MTVSPTIALGSIRVGHGFDVHQFAPDRKLVLGGCTIEHSLGLLGHSDADVVLHALIDALLGAVARGDIGQWFPNTDEQYRNADSAQLLQVVWNALSAEGWQILNCGIVVLAEEPKLAPHIPNMRERIAGLLGVSKEQVGLKATTTEKLGYVGRGEGLSASAVALLCKPAS